MTLNITCPHCDRGSTVHESGLFTCPHCGQVLDVTPPAAPPPLPAVVNNYNPPSRPSSSFDAPLFAESGVLITRSQVIMRGATFAVPQIAGVVNRQIPAKRGWPIFFILVGITFIGGASNGGGSASYIIAAMMIIPSILLLLARRTIYAIALQANGGEYNLEFKKPDEAQRAAWALSQAMTAR